MSTPSESGYDHILESLKQDFIDEANDILNEVDITIENLRSGQVEQKEGIDELLRKAHSLKGSAGVSRYKATALIMHSMEDYMQKIETINDRDFRNLQIFSDKAREDISGTLAEVPRDALSRQLPNYSENIDTENDPDGVTALLVVNDRLSGKIFEKEFSQHGLRVVSSRHSFEAIEMAVHVKPDFIVISGVLDELSGVDVACALKAMPKTSSIPVSVMTSFERNHPDLQGLPESISLIQKSNLSEDLDNALSIAKLR